MKFKKFLLCLILLSSSCSPSSPLSNASSIEVSSESSKTSSTSISSTSSESSSTASISAPRVTSVRIDGEKYFYIGNPVPDSFSVRVTLSDGSSFSTKDALIDIVGSMKEVGECKVYIYYKDKRYTDYLYIFGDEIDSVDSSSIDMSSTAESVETTTEDLTKYKPFDLENINYNCEINIQSEKKLYDRIEDANNNLNTNLINNSETNNYSIKSEDTTKILAIVEDLSELENDEEFPGSYIVSKYTFNRTGRKSQGNYIYNNDKNVNSENKIIEANYFYRIRFKEYACDTKRLETISYEEIEGRSFRHLKLSEFVFKEAFALSNNKKITIEANEPLCWYKVYNSVGKHPDKDIFKNDDVNNFPQPHITFLYNHYGDRSLTYADNVSFIGKIGKVTLTFKYYIDNELTIEKKMNKDVFISFKGESHVKTLDTFAYSNFSCKITLI